VIALSTCAAILVGLLISLKWAKSRSKHASPCRQCTAPMPPGWPSDLCATCQRVREELQLLRTGWRASSSLQWLVRRDAEQLGPYGLAALRELAERGKLAADDLVWTQGMGAWRRADRIEGLLMPGKPPAAPPGKRVRERPKPAAAAAPAPVVASPSQRPATAVRTATAARTAADWWPKTPVKAKPSVVAVSAPTRSTAAPAAGAAPAAAARRVRAAPQETSHRSNFLVAHWRGELSLRAAFWRIWLPVTLLLTAAILIATAPDVVARIAGRPGTRDSALWIAAVLAAAGVIVLWQSVGLWKSSDRESARSKGRGWAVAAKACVILGVLQLAGAALREYPLLQQAFAPAARPDVRSAELHVINHGTTVAIGGRLSAGTSEMLRIVLDATPTIRLVQLETTGGSLGEATRTGKLIAARRLATFVPHDCDSACILTFLSGKERYVGSQGKLAFRAMTAAAVGERTAQAANDLLRDALAAQGVPAVFSQHALATLAPRVWYPNTQELLDARVVTAVVDQNEYVRNGFNAARAELEADFLSVPVFAVLQRLEPTTFTDLRDTYVSGVLGGVPRNEMSAKVRATMMEKVIPKYVRMAPDHELIAYWRTQIEKAQELRAIDPKYCAEFLAPQPGADTRELVSLFSPKAQQADIQALADLMVAGSQHPQNVPQGKAVQNALRESAHRAEESVPGALQLVANPGMATTQPSEFCHAEVAFYESILALPTNRAGPLLRYLVAQG